MANKDHAHKGETLASLAIEENIPLTCKCDIYNDLSNVLTIDVLYDSGALQDNYISERIAHWLDDDMNVNNRMLTCP